MQSDASVHVIRLKPHEDLKVSLMEFASKNQIGAAVIISAVGSLEQVHLRFANQPIGQTLSGFHEIISLTGTLCANSCHLHLAVSNNTGQTIGGHLLDGNIIYTTAEIAIAVLHDIVFDREKDGTYGFAELVIREK